MAFASYARGRSRFGGRASHALAVMGAHLPDAIPAFDPRTLPGLAFWYHPAAADVVKDGTTGKTSRFIDLSGNGHDATQFTAASQFTWGATSLGGAPGLTCGAATSMSGPTVDISAGFLFATKALTSTTAVGFLGGIYDNSANNRLWLDVNNGSVRCRVWQNATTYIGRQSAASLLATNAVGVITIAWDGTTSPTGIKIYLNGTEIDTLSESSGTFTGTTASTIPFVVGAEGSAGTGWQGVIGDYLLCTGAQTTANRQALESALSGATPLFVPPAPAAKLAGDIYVSTTGTATAAGTLADPLNFQTLLNAGVQAGTTVWMRAGTYALDAVVNFAGTSSAMTWIRAYQSGSFGNERVIIDGSYKSNGAYIGIRDLEIMYSETTRSTTQSGSDPTDVPRQGRTTYIAAPNNKVINCILHDLGDSLFAGEPADGLEIHGTIAYNSGWDAPDRGHGHAFYQQNRTSTRTVHCNVVFNHFSTGLKVGGTSDAALEHFDFQHNASFTNGSPSALHGPTWNLDLEGGTPISNNTWDDNSFYHIGGLTDNVHLNVATASPPAANLTFTNNVCQGPVQFNEATAYVSTGNTITTGADTLNDGQTTLISFRVPSGYDHTGDTVNSNTYATPGGAGLKNPFFYFENGVGNVWTFAQWQANTGFDASGTFVSGQLTTPIVKVDVNAYESGRAHIRCFNPAGSASLSVDLSSVLAVGNVYSIWHVYNLSGTPVISSATYDGNPVSLAQTGYTAPIPIGLSTAPASTSPTFNAFLVRRVG